MRPRRWWPGAFDSSKRRREERAAAEAPAFANVALVVGSTDVIGAALLDVLLSPDAPAGPWKVYALSRRALPPWSPSAEASSSSNRSTVVRLHVDVADPAAVAQVLVPLTDITHVFYAGWPPFPGSIEAQAGEAKCAMLRKVLSAVVPKCPALAHVYLQTGPKPLTSVHAAIRAQREDLPRLDYPDLEDAVLDELADSHPDGAAITWSVHRPSTIFGLSPPSIRNKEKMKVWRFGIWHNLVAVLWFMSLLLPTASASMQPENGVCPVTPMESYFIPRTTCPVVQLSNDHWVHAKRELTSNLKLNLSQLLPSLEQLGFILVFVSCFAPWNYIMNVNLNMTTTILSWETKLSYVWVCNLVSSIVHYTSWILYDLYLHLKDTESTKSTCSVIYKNVPIFLVHAVFLLILGHRHKMAIQGFMHTKQATSLLLTLIVFLTCWFWLLIILDITTLGLEILACIVMVPMYFTKWMTVKKFEWIPFLLKVGGLVGQFTIHEDRKSWWYHQSYRAGILCRIIELMISYHPFLDFLKSTVKNRLNR